MAKTATNLPKSFQTLDKCNTFEERLLRKFINFSIKAGKKVRCYNFFIKFFSYNFKLNLAIQKKNLILAKKQKQRKNLVRISSTKLFERFQKKMLHREYLLARKLYHLRFRSRKRWHALGHYRRRRLIKLRFRPSFLFRRIRNDDSHLFIKKISEEVYQKRLRFCLDLLVNEVTKRKSKSFNFINIYGHRFRTWWRRRELKKELLQEIADLKHKKKYISRKRRPIVKFAKFLGRYRPVVRLRTRRKGSQLLAIPDGFRKKSGIIRYILSWFKEDLLLESHKKPFYARYEQALGRFITFSKNSRGLKKYLEYHSTALLNNYFRFMLRSKKRRRHFRRS